MRNVKALGVAWMTLSPHPKASTTQTGSDRQKGDVGRFFGANRLREKHGRRNGRRNLPLICSDALAPSSNARSP